MIEQIIDLLLKNEFYGVGKYTEIAKGERELVTNWKGFKRKIIRKWRLRKL